MNNVHLRFYNYKDNSPRPRHPLNILEHPVCFFHWKDRNSDEHQEPLRHGIPRHLQAVRPWFAEHHTNYENSPECRFLFQWDWRGKHPTVPLDR